MRRPDLRDVAVVTLAALVLAACSSSSKVGSTTTPTAARSASTTAGSGTVTTVNRTGDAAFAKRLLGHSELLDYVPGGPTDVRRTVSAYLHGLGMPDNQFAAETERLQRLGFVAGTDQNFASPKMPSVGGISIVVEFRTRAGALGYVATEPTIAPPQIKLTPFAVSGVPGAHGFDLTGPSGAGHNIAFADGSFYYLVGVGAPTASSLPPRERLIQAAALLYRRVQGLPNS